MEFDSLRAIFDRVRRNRQALSAFVPHREAELAEIALGFAELGYRMACLREEGTQTLCIERVAAPHVPACCLHPT